MNNKLDMISNLTGLYKGYSQCKGYSQFGLSKISSEYFRNNLDYLSSTHEMKTKFKRTLSMFYGYYNIIKHTRLETHSSTKSIADNIKNTRFFRKK